tara:strand:- start:703 stop:843 length:141 start_codon:yes stop_codon:yes gene_type:complete
LLLAFYILYGTKEKLNLEDHQVNYLDLQVEKQTRSNKLYKKGEKVC